MFRLFVSRIGHFETQQLTPPPVVEEKPGHALEIVCCLLLKWLELELELEFQFIMRVDLFREARESRRLDIETSTILAAVFTCLAAVPLCCLLPPELALTGVIG